MKPFSPRLAFAGLCLAASAGFPVFLTSSIERTAAKTGRMPPDLSGTWKINEDLSQRLQQSGPSGEERPPGGWSGRRGGRGGGGMGRRGGGGGGFPAGGAGGPEGAPPEGGTGFAGAVGAMTIAWAAPQLTVTYPGDRKRVLYTDNRKVQEQRPDGGKIKTQAHWTDAGSLEVVTKMDDGTTRTEIFELSNDGHRLFVIVGIEGRGPRPRQVRRVYDKLEAPDKEEEEQEDPQLA